MKTSKKLAAILLAITISLTLATDTFAISFSRPYSYFAGEVLSIGDGRIYVKADASRADTIVFLVSENTYLLGDDIEAGHIIRGYYPLSGNTAFDFLEWVILEVSPEEETGKYLILAEEYQERHGTFSRQRVKALVKDSFEVGEVIRGYSSWSSWPDFNLLEFPEYPAVFIVNGNYNTLVGRFEGYMFSDDFFEGSRLRLDINENTEIFTVTGEVFTGKLGDADLAVVYEDIVYEYPPSVTPYKIVVLREFPPREAITVELVSEPRLLTPIELERFGITIPETILSQITFENIEITFQETFPEIEIIFPEIVVNGVPITDEWAIVVGDSIFPTHVPLRPVLEALGTEPSWNSETREVTLTNLNGDVVSFQIDLPGFRVGDEEIILRHSYMIEDLAITVAQTAVIVDDRTFVPIQFFRIVFGMNNAYFEGGTVFIDNDEPMI